jgi:hypothetical protein
MKFMDKFIQEKTNIALESMSEDNAYKYTNLEDINIISKNKFLLWKILKNC